MRSVQRDKYKTELLGQIRQQRLNLSLAKNQWLEITAPYDRGWCALVNLRRYVVVAGTILTIWNVRQPDKTVKWIKRGLSTWSMWRAIRTSLNHPFFKS